MSEIILLDHHKAIETLENLETLEIEQLNNIKKELSNFYFSIEDLQSIFLKLKQLNIIEIQKFLKTYVPITLEAIVIIPSIGQDQQSPFLQLSISNISAFDEKETPNNDLNKILQLLGMLLGEENFMYKENEKDFKLLVQENNHCCQVTFKISRSKSALTKPLTIAFFISEDLGMDFLEKVIEELTNKLSLYLYPSTSIVNNALPTFNLNQRRSKNEFVKFFQYKCLSFEQIQNICRLIAESFNKPNRISPKRIKEPEINTLVYNLTDYCKQEEETTRRDVLFHTRVYQVGAFGSSNTGYYYSIY